MEFLKKNYIKMILTALALVAVVFAIIAAINAFGASAALKKEGVEGLLTAAGKANENTAGGLTARALLFLGAAASCLCIAAFLVLKMFDLNKKIAACVLISGAVIATVLIVVSIFVGSGALGDLSKAVKDAKTSYDTAKTAFDAGLIQQVQLDLAKFGVNAAKSAFTNQIATTVIYLVTLGLAPAVFGAKKLCHKCNKEQVK